MAYNTSDYLVYMVKIRAFIWPVLMTLFDNIFSERCQHDNHHTATLPNHLHNKANICKRNITRETGKNKKAE